MSNKMKLKKIMTIRNNGIHLSTVMLVEIISHINRRTNSCYLGEIHAYYHSKRDTNSLKSYSLAGIRAHLRVMEKRGFIFKQRDGQYMSYKTTIKGQILVKGLF